MEKVKTIFTALMSAFFSAFGLLAIPLLLLVGSNITDYVTGLMAAKSRNQKLESKVGIKGIFKKIAMYFLVFVGFMLDTLISYSISKIGITLPFDGLVACLITIWLVCNEFISILENLIDIGVEMPPFVKPIVEMIKGEAEKKIPLNNEKESEK